MLRSASGSTTENVVIGSLSTYGVKDEEDGEQPDDEGRPVLVRVTTITIPTADAGGLAQDGTITHDGVSYTVRDWERIEDGALTRVIVVES